jgi:hypothetical protein
VSAATDQLEALSLHGQALLSLLQLLLVLVRTLVSSVVVVLVV